MSIRLNLSPHRTQTNPPSVLYWVYKIDPLTRAKKDKRVEGTTEAAAAFEVDVENPDTGRPLRVQGVSASGEERASMVGLDLH